MHWKQYRESQGSPASHEIVICCDERDAGHPFVLARIALYNKAGKHVHLKITKPGAKKNDPKKSRQEAGRKAIAPIIEAQARRPRSVAKEGN